MCTCTCSTLSRTIHAFINEAYKVCGAKYTSEWKIQKGHIGIVEKAQETSSDSDMHNTVCLSLLYFMNSGCVLEIRETHITGNNLIPISVPIHFTCT